jgi:hypothetical protein
VRKLFLILLLAVLPLQYAWSAAAAYCGHEQGKVQHFGHHAHQHHAGSSADDNTNDDGKLPGKAKFHADCAVCHHAVQAFLLTEIAPPLASGGTAYPPPFDPRYSSHIAEGPKRPDWLLAA